ncbi:hypothetical protein GC197_17105 [bacterium]|nr:hypothetical protein [bacterium]
MLRSTVFLGVALASLLGTTAFAAPQIDSISLRGLTIGDKTRLTLQGKELGPETEVQFDFPVASAVVLEGSNDKRLDLEVELPADVAPRQGHLRVRSSTGISSPITLGVDRLPNGPFVDKIEQLPIAMSGSLGGAQLLTTTFQGKAKQRVVVDVEAQRIGSKLQPLVSIVDERDTQLAYSSRDAAAQGDARLVIELPEDGTYTVKLHDALFRGASPGHFRLKVGDFQVADLAYPLAIRHQKDSENLSLLASHATAQPGQVNLSAALPKEEQLASMPVELATPFSGPRPRVIVSDIDEFAETDGRDAKKSIGAAPIGISGILKQPKERDEFLVDVTPGTKYRAELFAQRINSPVDAVLEIRKPDGGMLSSADDQKDTPDPAAVFDVPKEVNQIKLSVRDLSGEGGDLHVYRLVVTPVRHPDFTLKVPNQAINIPAGGSAVMEVIAERRAFKGPIALALPNLPSGVEVSLNEIPAGADRALVTLTAAKDAAASAVGPLLGTTKIGEQTTRRIANIGNQASTIGLPPEQTDLGIAVVASPKLILAFQSTPPADAMGLGQSTELSVKVERGAKQTGPVRFSLVTSQIVPEDKGKPDLNKAIKLAGNPVLAADQSEMKLSLSAPQELADIAWDVAVRGELLSADKKQVLAEATTPAIRMTLGSPLFLALTGETVVRLKGKITRAGGFAEPVTVVAEGLPKEAKAAEVVVPGDKTDFVVEITLPPGIKPDQLKQVRLVAKTKHSGKDATSNPIGIKLETGTK